MHKNPIVYIMFVILLMRIVVYKRVLLSRVPKLTRYYNVPPSRSQYSSKTEKRKAKRKWTGGSNAASSQSGSGGNYYIYGCDGLVCYWLDSSPYGKKVTNCHFL